MFDHIVFFGRFGMAAFVQAFFEVVHSAAQVFADIAQFFRAEYQHHNHQHDNP